MGQEREIIIHLPKNYDSKSKKKYPVIYALDGGSLSNPTAARIGEISANGKFPEMIVVGIPNMTAKNRQKDLLPPYMKIDLEVENSPFGRGDKFLAFIETELMPYLKTNYKTSLSGNAPACRRNFCSYHSPLGIAIPVHLPKTSHCRMTIVIRILTLLPEFIVKNLIFGVYTETLPK